MERLTFDGNFCDIAQCTSTPGGSFCEDGTCSTRKVWERLKAYEDSSLTPERCAEFARADEEGRYIVMRDADQEGVARLCELAEADKDGRVVVLPCKVGDTVYKTITIKDQAPIIMESQVKTLGQAADIAQLIGKRNKVINVFLTREEAEKALEVKDGRCKN